MKRRWTPRVSISFKLVGFTAITLAAITGILTWYFQSRQVAALATEQTDRARIYGDVLANGLRSAVAFSDRETAREVLTPLTSDVDVASTTLYGADGAVLYSSGDTSPWVARARQGVRATRVANLRHRVAVVTPVVSLEGPRGTLVIELSKERLAAQQQAVEDAALFVGLVALAAGVIAAWWIARSLVRRLRAIDRVATSVAAGSLDHPAAVVDSADEIGVLAGAFNAMLVQLRDANRGLESRVERRTGQLREANAQLQSELKRRLTMEAELRQAQKLESVGRLASGIAHEINTPVQFVADSSSFLGEATAEMIAGLEERQELVKQLAAGEVTVDEVIARIEESNVAHDLPYLIQQMPKAIVRVKQGCERIAKIVTAMKEFAFVDQTTQAAADLNRAIESTLVVASNEYKYVADIVTELGELPLVVCHLSELNQVILNIVVNAAHAIEHVVAGTDNRGTIRITTAVDGEHVVISISDDGCGIPAEIVDKVFDPFFTTKEIGKGTGQGLAIARSVVVDKHGGRLTVQSTPKVGTTFTMQLPIAGHISPPSALREAA